MTEPVAPSDQTLISQTLAGDRRAFTLLMGRHSADLYRFVARRLRDPEESYDVVQETFVSAWRALRRYDPARPFDIWLRAIAFNNCRDRGRKAAVRKVLRRLAPMGPEVETVPDSQPLADEQLEAKAAQRRFDAALAELPAHLRDTLTLTLWDGLSHGEVAELLGINVKAVENRLYRAKVLLSQALAEKAWT